MQGIADYTFVRPLGSGNNGHFFLARRPPRLPVEAEFVAVKVLSAESTEVAFRRATRELTAFAAVRSPYLVAAYDAGQHDGVFFYSTEYLPEGSLDDAPQPWDPPKVLPAVAHAARAADALHRAGIVHRDIKPGNILLDAGGGKLTDLGLSHLFTEGVTVTGMGSLDSVQYVDPGILLGEPSGPDNDVWSLGVVLHHVFAGRGVHGELPRDDGLMALRRVLSTPPRISEALAVPVKELISDCLAPAGRRPTAAVVAERIEALA
ncbi:protein kinase domain-containing protein [Virgisporangium aliadipatigenens]|uniref:protein kinase domain-containing protein n=1 Tax=Virgisporangium aliadipatigenens TaxID=741659 RepID=UPI0019423F40|nr:protein kinase [Virgisporangium aliadipatigenens]